MLNRIWPFNKFDEFWLFRWSAKLCGEDFTPPDKQMLQFIASVEEIMGSLRGPWALFTFVKWFIPAGLVGLVVGSLNDMRLCAVGVIAACSPLLFAVFRAYWKTK